MLTDAIDYYNDLLGNPQLAADSQAQLDQQTQARRLYFGERPVCSVLRPRFLSAGQFRFLQDRVQALLPAFAKTLQHALKDAEFRQQFRLTEIEEEVVRPDPGFAEPSPTARLDSFFVSEQELKFTEYNAETPAGAHYHDTLSEMFTGMPAFQEFTRKYQVRQLPARPGVLHALVGTFKEWAGNTSTPPRIGIIDWATVPTQSEFRLFQKYFTDMGYECRILTPEECEYRDGKLMAGDFHITLIYKRVLISELLLAGGLQHPIVRAILDGKVCMVNAFRCKILYKKASFAVLGDERNERLFTPTERQAIADHIPWTRVLEERKTRFAGQEIDLVPFALANRERLVLKPNDEYGGKGIVLGWTMDAATWEQSVQVALAAPTVVQERVNLPHEIFPSYHDGQVHFIDRMLDTNPFVGNGTTMDGCLTRISTEVLLNVTAGGGSTVPTFVVEER